MNPGPAARPADIRVVVVSHQSAATLEECLLRLRAAQGVGEIRVVDNHSRDGSLEIVQRHATADPRVRFVANPDNPGFAVACNQGAREPDIADPLPWLAFVNPDCLVEPESLARLRELASQRGGELLIGADLVGEDGVRDTAARRRHPNLGRMLARAWRGSEEPSAIAIDPDDTQTLQPVQATSGALMFMRRSLFSRLRGFDENYRLHAEDLDLCRRAQQAGASIAVANQVRVVHVRGVSSRGRPLFVEWHKHRGLWRYFRKFEAPTRTPPVQAAVFMAIWLRFPVALLRRMWATDV